MSKKNILLHVHIFKNAGSSFDDALHHFFGKGFVDHRDDKDLKKGKMDYLLKYLDSNPKVEAFSSHSIHFLPEESDAYGFFTAYFLRHPIDRIRSVYSFEKKQMPAKTQGSQKAKELNFNNFVLWYMEETSPQTIRNAQTIFLSGDGLGSHNIEQKFKTALTNLKNTPLIGIVDRYDESMVVFEEYLKDYFPGIDLSYIRRNVTERNLEASVEEKVKKVLSQLDAQSQQEVIEKNAFDTQLYTDANAQLDSKISKIENFQKKLDNFKERCTLKLINTKVNKKEYGGVLNLLLPLSQKGFHTIQLHLALANAHKELKQYPEALKIFEETKKKFSNNPWPYFYEAEIYKLMGDTKKAKMLFKTHKNKFKDNINIVKIFENILG